MNPVYNAFIYVVWFFATYYVVVFMLLLILGRKKLYEDRSKKYDRSKFVSVIVSAYNEEEKISETIKSLKKILHKNIEFIILNDGSKDKTSQIVKKEIKGDSRFVFIDNKKNKGKANCLNQGIAVARGEYVACMDADSVTGNDIFKKVLPYFEDDKVGAVTISVEVKNPKTLLHRIIELEFTIGLSLFLKVATFFNTVFVTPGPFSVYRKSVLDEIDGFDPANITEDLEIAYRIHKFGYKIENCAEAKVYTILPPTFKQIFIQRRRWYSGALQTLHKHKDMMFNRKYGFFSVMVPYNYLLTFTGIVVFFMSTYLLGKNIVNNLWSMQYTGFNLLNRLRDFNFDFLSISNVSFISLSSLVLGIVVLIIGLRFAKKKLSIRKLSIVAFPLMFFYYQIWWIGSIIKVIRGNKIKWR